MYPPKSIRQTALVVCLLAVASLLVAQRLPFQRVPIKDKRGDLLELDCVPLLLDANDRFWFHDVSKGLFVYDGMGARNFLPEQGAHGRITQMATDQYDYLWYVSSSEAGQAGRIARSREPLPDGPLAQDFQFVDTVGTTPLARGGFTYLAVSADGGTLWTNTDRYLIRYRLTGPEELLVDTIYTITAELNKYQINGIQFDEARQVVYFATNENKLLSCPTTATGPEDVRTLADFEEFTLLMGRTTAGHLVVRQEGHLIVFDPTQGDRADYAPIDLPFADFAYAFRAVNAPGGNILVVTQGRAMHEIDPATGTTVAVYRPGDGLPDVAPHALYLDPEGHYWLGTYEGVYLMSADYASVMAPMPPTELLPEGTIMSSVLLDGPDADWLMVATTEGLLIGDEANGQWRKFTEDNGLTMNAVITLAQGVPGQVLVGDRNRVQSLTPRGAPAPFTWPADDPTPIELFGRPYEVRRIRSDRCFLYTATTITGTNGEAVPLLWSGNYVQGQVLTADGSAVWFPRSTGYLEHAVPKWHAAADGRLYVYSAAGLQRTTRPVTTEMLAELRIEANLHPRIPALHVCPDTNFFETLTLRYDTTELRGIYHFEEHLGSYWASSEAGLYRLDGSEFQPTHFFPTPFKDTPRSLVEAGGLLYGGTPNGLLVIDPATNRSLGYYDSADGLLGQRNFSPKALAVSKDGTINYVTDRGLIRLRPAIAERDPPFRSLQLREWTYTEDDWGNNALSAAYALPNFNDRHVTYQTWLEGYDKEWQDQEYSQKVRYTNLNAFFFDKTYRLKVRATDKLDNEAILEAPSFTVSPPLYFRWWAFLIYTGLLALLVRAFTRYRVREAEKAVRLEEAAIIRTQRDEITAKNDQNELLLKEIHHRVKNNLETVSSLLELQSATLDEGPALSAMQAGQSRVQSMGLLHQKLYQGKNLAAIEMRDYFRNLADALLETYEAEDRINVTVDMPPLEVDIDRAVPLGLIVNELLTNAIKYAFPGADAGAVVVGLSEVGGDRYRLVVADNGVGKDVAAGSRGTGFGTRLIQLLTRQLGGELRQENDDGLRTELVFTPQS